MKPRTYYVGCGSELIGPNSAADAVAIGEDWAREYPSDSTTCGTARIELIPADDGARLREYCDRTGTETGRPLNHGTTVSSRPGAMFND